MKKKMRLWPAVLLFAAAMLLVSCGGRKADAASDAVTYTSIDEVKDKKIGIQTGTSFDALIKEKMPNASCSYYNTLPDLIGALKSGKIEAFPGDEPQLMVTMAEDPAVTILKERLDRFDFGCAFPKTEKGAALRDEINAYLEEIKEDGTLDEINEVWFGTDEEKKVVPDYKSLPAPKGVLILATEGAYPPFNYYKDNQLVGQEIDFLARFCEKYGYGLRVDAMTLDAIIPSITTGKADFGASGLTITPERAESVYFSDPYYSGGTVVAVLDKDYSVGAGPIRSIIESFKKTFLKEKRYLMFTRGIIVTLIITILSVFCGTALGFGVFMWCRKGQKFANAVTNFMVWLIQGMPIVVLLMILYYIVFGSLSIRGIWVSVFGFSLTFGAAVFGMIQSGVAAVDKGQTEAAYALGFSDRQTFFEIVLPQAARFFMGSYKSEIVSLIKSTAVVGYIAVQDLTKMGDIVRSRTYEAFFPLIAVAVFYFILAWILTTIVDRITIGVEPKKRAKIKLLEGVKTDD